MRRGFRGMLLVAAILFVTAGSASAQAIGSIFGKVTDASGGVLPGVTVTVTGSGLQQPLVQVTTATGAYQFPIVPIGTYSVTFELSSFKKAVRPGVVIVSGFSAPIDQKMELGAMTDSITVSGAAPVVDTKKTSSGATFTREILEGIPTARDPWQIIGMTPGVKAGLNVGGSASGQQVGLESRGTSGSVQWNLEGGSITDLSSNSSPSYFNFDSFEQIQVINGGGDVSVQSSGLSINLVTKSGSNVFKGTAVGTFENDRMQGNNVTRELFFRGGNGFLSGAPIKEISVYSAEYGGPIKKNRLWFWLAADKQDINAGVLNFFEGTPGTFCGDIVAARAAGVLAAAIKYDQLSEVQACLSNDKTVIKDLNWKFNYQLNSSNKFQYLFTSDNKYRNRRDASSNTAVEATSTQTSDMPKGIGYWGLPLPTHSLTHTLILTDRLVFNNMFTYVHGGFFLDYQDTDKCGGSRWLPESKNPADYMTGARAGADCMWNISQLSNRTTGYQSRSKPSTYQTERHSWEAKTDGTYFLSNMLGGDHSLKFGVGWRRNPVMTFAHTSGGARPTVQCVGNNAANCGTGAFVPVGSATGFVPYAASLVRDGVSTNVDWWTYNGYLQDSFSRGKLRLNGGIRYDWQTSKLLAGCVPANVLRPDLLPGQCQDETNLSVDPVTQVATKIQPFGNWGPRLSATYDLFGNGKTSIKASASYYYSTRIFLANELNSLGSVSLTWGNNLSSGACNTTAGGSCWTDANRDGFVQVNELIGTPSGSTSRFNTATGVLAPGQNEVDKSAKIGRTREATVGVAHELIPNLALGVDFIYRKYDRGTRDYTIGYQPGGPLYPISNLYVGPFTHTDATTGFSGTYYTICQGCSRPSGIGSITMTNPNYTIYRGVDLTATKRFSNRWQMQASVTLQTSPGFTVEGGYSNPTGLNLSNGRSTLDRYLFKLNGSYQMPWDITVAGNLQIADGNTRTLSINGPGNVYGGLSSTGAATTISGYDTLNFELAGTTKNDPIKLLDMGLQKVFSLRGGKNRIKLMLDGFNLLNVNTVTGWSSSNRSGSTFNNPNGIVPPRVFRVGAQLSF